MDGFFNRFAYRLGTKQIDLINDDIRIALLTSAYTPDFANHNTWSQVSANEVVGTGYTAGGMALAGKTFTEDEGNNWVWYDCNDIIWTSSTITARYAILYDNTLAGKDLIMLFDFVTDKISTGGDFQVTINANGLFRIS